MLDSRTNHRLKKRNYKKQKNKIKKRNIYDKRNAFSLQQKEAVLVAFRISKVRELKRKGEESEKVICGSTNFLRICNSLLDLSNFSTVIWEKILLFEIFWGGCKIFLDCPFSASVVTDQGVVEIIFMVIRPNMDKKWWIALSTGKMRQIPVY